ncbi:MAG: hypothetical protein H0W54_05150, partial [Rubrobacter sp.]|nr:hypothetical protein [Rubrobacter sp.]
MCDNIRALAPLEVREGALRGGGDLERFYCMISTSQFKNGAAIRVDG